MIVDERASGRSPQNPAYKPAHGFSFASIFLKDDAKTIDWEATLGMPPVIARYSRNPVPCRCEAAVVRVPQLRGRSCGSFLLGGNLRQFNGLARRIHWRCRIASETEAILFVEIV